MTTALRLGVREVLLSAAVVFVATLAMFLVAYYATGEIQKEKLGIDVAKGPVAAYADWWGAVASGDISGNYQAAGGFHRQIGNSAGTSAILVVLAMIVTVGAGVACASFLLAFQQRRAAAIIEGLGYLSGAVPVFLVAVLVIVAVPNGLIDADSRKTFFQNLVPFVIFAGVLAVGSGALGEIIRVFRIELARILREPYIQAARARNSSMALHVSKAAVVPLLSAVVARVPFFVGASLIVERMFGIHGLGELMLLSANEGNFAKLMAVTLVILLIVVAGRILNRIVVGLIDPRVL